MLREAVREATQDAGPEISYTFAHLGAEWQGALVLAGAALAAWWGWTRYGPLPSGGWGVLARCCRSLGLALAVILLAGPSKQMIDGTTVGGRMVIAVDGSLSMAQTDVAMGATMASRISVADLLYQALANHPLKPEWRMIGGIDGPFAPGMSASGASSPLGEDLDRVVAERRPDLLVTVSDFRTTAGPGLTQIASDWSRQRSDMRVMALVVGSDRIEPDFRIDDIKMNTAPALDDAEQMRLNLAVRASTSPIMVTVYVDGQVVSEREVVPGSAAADPTQHQVLTVDQSVPFTKAGSSTVSIVVRTQGREQRAEIPVRVAARPLKVLMLAHRPSPEMRFLREAMRRDKTITIHAYLADGNWRRWSQGSEAEAGPIILPVDGAAPGSYDVILNYDLGADAPFTPGQIQAMHDAVVAHILQ